MRNGQVRMNESQKLLSRAHKSNETLQETVFTEFFLYHFFWMRIEYSVESKMAPIDYCFSCGFTIWRWYIQNGSILIYKCYV